MSGRPIRAFLALEIPETVRSKLANAVDEGLAMACFEAQWERILEALGAQETVTPHNAAKLVKDGTVTIDELVVAVKISLGDHSVATCPASDVDGSGDVTVDEIVRAVNAALEGCAE